MTHTQKGLLCIRAVFPVIFTEGGDTLSLDFPAQTKRESIFYQQKRKRVPGQAATHTEHEALPPRAIDLPGAALIAETKVWSEHEERSASFISACEMFSVNV